MINMLLCKGRIPLTDAIKFSFAILLKHGKPADAWSVEVFLTFAR